MHRIKGLRKPNKPRKIRDRHQDLKSVPEIPKTAGDEAQTGSQKSQPVENCIAQ